MNLETVQTGKEYRYITPVDESGLPFCFAPTVDLPPVRQTPRVIDGVQIREADLNHMFPKHGVAISSSPALGDDVARAALTGARVQWVDFGQHHEVYNNAFVDPDHPQTREQLFVTLAMAAAGSIPEHAIDLSGAEPQIVGLTNYQRKALWRSGQVSVMCQADVSRYMLEYCLEVETDHIDPLRIEEFFYTFDHDKRLRLGKTLAKQIIDRAAEPLEPVYTQARRDNVLTFVHVGNTKCKAPDNPRDFVAQKLTVGHSFGPVFNALHQRLAGERRRTYDDYTNDFQVMSVA